MASWLNDMKNDREKRRNQMVEYEDRLKLKRHDFTILDKFDFKFTPVVFRN